MNELVLAGHSFGGITAITSACKLGESVKAVLAMDPWLYAFCEDFQSGELHL